MSFFLPYQKRWIQDSSRIKIMEKSRQIGMSWATAYRALRKAILTPRASIWICSRDVQQAQLFLNDCKSFASILNQAYHERLLGNGAKLRTLLRLCNGSTLTLISSAVNAQAGKRGSRILDEFALHEDSEALYNIAYPGITWGGQLEIISTHRGAHNFFNRLIEEARHGGNPKKISVHRVTLVDALEQGFLEKLKSKLPPDDPRQAMDAGDYYNFIKGSCATEKSFLQEYMCQPIDRSDALLTYDSIQKCLYSDGENWQQRSDGIPLMGVDLARTNDLSTFIVLEYSNDHFYIRHLQCLKDAPFDQQESVFDRLFQQFNIQRACIDQTGIGRQFLERAQRRFGSSAVEGVQFTPKTKEQLAYALKAQMDRRTLHLPADPDLIDDLQSLQIDEQGRLSAKHGPNGHADRFWGLALAIHANQFLPEPSFATETFSFSPPSDRAVCCL